MSSIFLLLCVLPSLTTVLGSSDQDCTLNRLPSLYEQYCCVEVNRGKSFILSDNENKIQYIMCPRETPASCSSVNIFPSCSGVRTYRPTVTSGYYNIMLANGTVITEYCDELKFNQLNINSCVELKALLPNISSGYYNTQVNGDSETVYCNLDELCGENGGWMRVGHLNMTDSKDSCPAGFQTYDINGIRSCGRSSIYCQSVMLPSHGVNYTQVCGRVTGYQKGRPNAFNFNFTGQRGNIELAYVDGVSITRGSPRNHIWTYVASPKEDQKRCPCDKGAAVRTVGTIPSFVGEDYFCESAVESGLINVTTLYTDDLLWDGEQCGSIQEACCQASRDMPWFKKVLDTPSTDYLELRVCGDQEVDNEDVSVNFFEIYIK